MLPCLDMFNGQPIITNFSQIDTLFVKRFFVTGDNSRCFLAGASDHGDPMGVCIGLSFDWIRHHSQNRMDTFVSHINTPSRIRDISNLSFKYNHMDDLVSIKSYLDSLGYSNIEHKVYNHHLGSQQLADILCEYKGYLLVFYIDQTLQSGHVVALFNDSKGCEFFEPNYGSAFFAKKKDFNKWYEYFSWAQAARKNYYDLPNKYRGPDVPARHYDSFDIFIFNNSPPSLWKKIFG